MKVALLPEDIGELRVGGMNQIGRDAKLRDAGMKRAKTLITNIGSADETEKSADWHGCIHCQDEETVSEHSGKIEGEPIY